MRENNPVNVSSLAADEALEYAREAENILADLGKIYASTPGDRAAIGRRQQRLGVVLKLGGIHAQLAQAEQLIGLRADLAPLIADMTTVPARVVTFDAHAEDALELAKPAPEASVTPLTDRIEAARGRGDL